MNATLETFIQEIRDAIVETLDENPGAPETDVTREVVENLLLGEDVDVQNEVRRRFGLD